MTITVQATYENGILKLEQPLPLKEQEKVRVTIHSETSPQIAAAATTPLPEDEIIRRIRTAKTYREWLEVTKLLPPDDGGYDIVKALDENRRWSGERPLLPDEAGQP